MSFFITFESDRKGEVFDNVKRFMLLSGKILVMFDDGSEQELSDVLGIKPYFYDEGQPTNY